MASSSPAYVYTPLPTLNHTRIVELLPNAHQAAPLVCRLVTLDLEADDILLRYEALSYTSGQPVFSERLFIQGPDDESNIQALHITPSLASALHRLRLRNSTVRRIWADAVCINQADTAEKGKQIPLMSIIYRGASRVVVWLDPSGTTHGDSEARTRRLNALIRQRSVRRGGLEYKSLVEAAGLLERHLSMPWFSRRWIFQKVVGHPDVKLLCGVEETGWLPLMALATNVFRHAKAAPAVVTSALMMYDLWRMGVLGEPRSGKCRRMTLLERFEHFGCADDRDRIYALAGLAEDGHGDDPLVPIPMDYSMSAEQLYIKLTETLVEAGHLSWVLQQACARRCTNKGLPSWVPDWRIPPTTKTFWGANLWGDPAEISEWETSVEQAGISAHVLTAELHCLFSRKKETGENGCHGDGTRTGVQNTGTDQRIFELSAGDYRGIHVDVFPLGVEWKNCEEYPHDGGAPALRAWVLDTASKIRERDLESEAERGLPPSVVPDLWATRAHLEKLLVKACHRYRGRLELALPDFGEEVDECISDGDPTADMEMIAEDVDALMSGRCLFSCRLW